MLHFKRSAWLAAILIVAWVCCVCATHASIIEDDDSKDVSKSIFTSLPLDPKEQEENTETPLHSEQMPKTRKFKYIDTDSEEPIYITDHWILVPKPRRPDLFTSTRKTEQFLSYDPDWPPMPNRHPFTSVEKNVPSSNGGSIYDPDYVSIVLSFIIGGMVCVIMGLVPVTYYYQKHLIYHEKYITSILHRMEIREHLSDYVDVSKFNNFVANEGNYLIWSLLKDEDEWSKLIDLVYKDNNSHSADVTKNRFSRHRHLVKHNQCQLYYLALQTALDDCKRKRDRDERIAPEDLQQPPVPPIE